MRTFSTAILYLAIFCPSGLADTSLRGQSVMFENDASRFEQDFGLLTDLKIKPTAVDVAMLQTLLGSLGALFGRSLSEADSLDEVVPADIDASRFEQDFGLLTDLKIKPTAVDVAMLQTLLGSLGALFGRSLSEADSLDEVVPADIDA
ncbi:MAG: uncharacterized protein KVP18_001620 [Porospora cf. gigantea A]|uniref:uncharacterized protein n=1 Tax=Porospora cf. gigantea A TaxID=2853593 RepID=UPI00355A5C2D|nr:MAG: hypothetical protein KVP18_001620 [Porospora cf. gigantea A]